MLKKRTAQAAQAATCSLLWTDRIRLYHRPPFEAEIAALQEMVIKDIPGRACSKRRPGFTGATCYKTAFPMWLARPGQRRGRCRRAGPEADERRIGGFFKPTVGARGR